MDRVGRDVLRTYLLGLLPEPARSELERGFLRSDSLYAQLLACEHDLLVDYARGALDQDEQHRVAERLVVTSADRRRVAIARVLATLFGAGRHGR